jgi:hypothetical protein
VPSAAQQQLNNPMETPKHKRQWVESVINSVSSWRNKFCYANGIETNPLMEKCFTRTGLVLLYKRCMNVLPPTRIRHCVHEDTIITLEMNKKTWKHEPLTMFDMRRGYIGFTEECSWQTWMQRSIASLSLQLNYKPEYYDIVLISFYFIPKKTQSHLSVITLTSTVIWQYMLSLIGLYALCSPAKLHHP